VLPGKTLACIYAAQYGPGSVLAYNELIVAAALTRFGRHYGFWISHIYVDSPASLAGGREIWGLPKELAEFTWESRPQNRVTVRRGTQLLCALGYGKPLWLWRQPVALPNLSTLGRGVLLYRGTWRSRFGLAAVQVDVPPDSPFAGLGLGRRGLPYLHADMTFYASAPCAAGRTAEPVRLLRPAPAGQG
jgi:hypothetical protein